MSIRKKLSFFYLSLLKFYEMFFLKMNSDLAKKLDSLITPEQRKMSIEAKKKIMKPLSKYESVFKDQEVEKEFFEIIKKKGIQLIFKNFSAIMGAQKDNVFTDGLSIVKKIAQYIENELVESLVRDGFFITLAFYDEKDQYFYFREIIKKIIFDESFDIEKFFNFKEINKQFKNQLEKKFFLANAYTKKRNMYTTECTFRQKFTDHRIVGFMIHYENEKRNSFLIDKINDVFMEQKGKPNIGCRFYKEPKALSLFQFVTIWLHGEICKRIDKIILNMSISKNCTNREMLNIKNFFMNFFKKKVTKDFFYFAINNNIFIANQKIKTEKIKNDEEFEKFLKEFFNENIEINKFVFFKNTDNFMKKIIKVSMPIKKINISRFFITTKKDNKFIVSIPDFSDKNLQNIFNYFFIKSIIKDKISASKTSHSSVFTIRDKEIKAFIKINNFFLLFKKFIQKNGEYDLKKIIKSSLSKNLQNLFELFIASLDYIDFDILKSDVTKLI